jgi:predicted metal-dependent hydrolase
LKSSIKIGERSIEYDYAYSTRRSLGISVYPDSSIEVKAPLNTSEEKIKEVLHKKASWIIKQQAIFNSFPKKRIIPKEYVSGETHLYLGKQYRLKVIQIKTKAEEQVKLIGAYIHIYTTDKENQKQNKRLLDKWYKKHCQEIFSKHFELCYERIKSHKIKRPELQIKIMKNRWGSYTESGSIILNPLLIRLPSFCIDYVITHELCHIKYNNHSRKFFDFLTLIMPDWEERKKRIEYFG